MVQDKSVDYLESWKFLNNRLTEAIQLQNVLLPTHTDNKFSTDTLLSTFITVVDLHFLSDSYIKIYIFVSGAKYIRNE